jgi:hypothetical protein
MYGKKVVEIRIIYMRKISFHHAGGDSDRWRRPNILKPLDSILPGHFSRRWTAHAARNTFAQRRLKN